MTFNSLTAGVDAPLKGPSGYGSFAPSGKF